MVCSMFLLSSLLLNDSGSGTRHIMSFSVRRLDDANVLPLIWIGRTVNPYNRSLTAGGSSGGEGALIGMKGSVLGVGSDIGG
jgi:hypothetical protein